MLSDFSVFSIGTAVIGVTAALVAVCLQRRLALAQEPVRRSAAMASLPALFQEGAMAMVFSGAGLFFADHLLKTPWHAAAIAALLFLMGVIGGQRRFLNALTEKAADANADVTFLRGSRRNYILFCIGICFVIAAGLAVFINQRT
jgi:hypothetical protein